MWRGGEGGAEGGRHISRAAWEDASSVLCSGKRSINKDEKRVAFMADYRAGLKSGPQVR